MKHLTRLTFLVALAAAGLATAVPASACRASYMMRSYFHETVPDLPEDGFAARATFTGTPGKLEFQLIEMLEGPAGVDHIVVETVVVGCIILPSPGQTGIIAGRVISQSGNTLTIELNPGPKQRDLQPAGAQ